VLLLLVRVMVLFRLSSSVPGSKQLYILSCGCYHVSHIISLEKLSSTYIKKM
jgi:hypothetical protein